MTQKTDFDGVTEENFAVLVLKISARDWLSTIAAPRRQRLVASLWADAQAALARQCEVQNVPTTMKLRLASP